jgi:hypothetical protein
MYSPGEQGGRQQQMSTGLTSHLSRMVAKLMSGIIIFAMFVFTQHVQKKMQEGKGSK